MRIQLLLILSLIIFNIRGQAQGRNQTYIDQSGAIQLCGPFDLNVLENDSVFSSWFQESQSQYMPDPGKVTWKGNLEGMNVEIYMGTWCGDNKNWVPKFVRLWEILGLKQDQLSFTALFSDSDRYKQGPDHEEKGKRIHRVPTFIFTRNGEEIGRIVEHPQNDLLTDVAQLALRGCLHCQAIKVQTF